MTTHATASELSRVAVASFLSAIILGYDVLLWGTRDAPPAGYSLFQVSVVVADIALAYVAAACCVLGVTFLVASVGERRRERRGSVDMVADNPPVPLGRRLKAALVTPSVRLRFRLLASFAVMLTMSTLVLIGLLDVYLWHPQSLVPDLSIDEIYAAMAAADQVASHNLSRAWAVYCMLLATAFALLVLVPPLARALSVRALLVLGIAPLALGVAAFPWAGFHMVWQLGDTFDPLDYSGPTTGSMIHMVGQVSWAALAFLLVAPRRPGAVSPRKDHAKGSSLPSRTQ